MGERGGRRGHRAPLVPIDRIGAHARAHTHRAGVSWVWITFARTHRRTCMHARARTHARARAHTHTHTHTHRAGWGWVTCRAWACCPRTSGEEITPFLFPLYVTCKSHHFSSLCMSRANHTIALPFVCHMQITPFLCTSRAKTASVTPPGGPAVPAHPAKTCLRVYIHIPPSLYARTLSRLVSMLVCRGASAAPAHPAPARMFMCAFLLVCPVFIALCIFHIYISLCVPKDGGHGGVGVGCALMSFASPED